MTLITNTFVAVLNMSITAGLMALVLLLLRPLLTRLPRVFGYMLWSVVLLRLLCPVSFTAVCSLLGAFGGSATVSEPVAALEQGAGAGLASSMQWAAPQSSSSNTMMAVLAVVWVCGAVVMLLLYTCALLRLRQRVAGAVPAGERVYSCSGIDSPFVFGLLRPSIYLPTGLADDKQQLIIKHEMAHIKRLDHVVKLIAFTALCIHWFNPLVWLSVALLSRDMELSCDEQVLSQLDGKERRRYSRLLLEMAVGHKPTVGALSFGENDVTRRIKNIMNYKHVARRFWWIAGALSIVLVVMLVANPIVAHEPEPVAEPYSQPQITVTEAAPTDDDTAAFVAIADTVPQITVTEAAPTDDDTAAFVAIADTVPQITVTEAAPTDDTATFVATVDTELQEISFIWPLVDKGYISVGLYGYRGHTGTDIAASHGTEIVAAQDGIVSYAVNYTNGAYGKRVDIDHGGGYMTRYGMCSEVLVETGQKVKQGQLIAKVGQTGNAYGNHCHFEIRFNSELLNPEDYIGSKPPEKEEDAS